MIESLDELNITEITKDNIDLFIETLEAIPERSFNGISKEIVLSHYSLIRILLKEF